MWNHRKGFTLIELLVVIGIILILMSIIVPIMHAVLERVKKNQTIALIGGIGMAMEAYKSSYGSYAPDRHPSLAVAGSPGISSESLIYYLSGGSIVYVPGSSPANYPWRHSLYHDTTGNENGRRAVPVYYPFKTKTLIDKNGNHAPELVDPWGKRLVYNSGNAKNYDSVPPNVYNQYAEPRHAIKQFDLFSAGPDGIYGTGDDICSWGDLPDPPSDYDYLIFNPPNPEP